MKLKSLFYVLAAAACLTAVSCEGEPQEPDEPQKVDATLKVDPSSLSISSAGEEKSLTVTSNADWSVTVPSDASWLTVSPLTGNGNGTVKVKAAANVGPEGQAAPERSATISVGVEGKEVKVNVVQSAEAIVFVVSGETAEIGAEGGKVRVTVEHNETYSVSGQLPEWISAGTKATKTDNLEFTVAANETYEAREATIAFSSASGKTGSVKVKQAAAAKPEPKSLKTKEDLIAFANAVNSSDAAAMAEYDPDGDGVYKLEADIDFGGAAITPIGNGIYANSSSYKGAAFKAVFDGQGHVVDNYVIESDVTNCAVGLFGILDSAVVKNVVVGPKAKVSTTVANQSQAGLLVGVAWDSDVENCTNKGSLSVTGGMDNKRSVGGGVVGVIIAKGKDCYVRNCVNEGVISSVNKVNTKNGGTGFSMGGVVGYTDAADAEKPFVVVVENCTNKADITAQATRMAGVVATPNKLTRIRGCVNEGNIVCNDVVAQNSRPSGIGSTTGDNCIIENCVNRGDIIFAVEGDTTHGFAAGICAQPNSGGQIIACENYGTIRSDIIKATAANKKYIGAIFTHGNQKAAQIKNCKVEGAVGPYTEDDTYKVVKLNKGNFEQYITLIPLTDKQNASVVLEGNYCTVEAPVEQKGTGIETDPYIIQNAAHLDAVRGQLDSAKVVYFELGKDIDMASVENWVPIQVENASYPVHFDGKGFTISNLKVNEAAKYGSLFGLVSGTIKNVKFQNCSIESSSNTPVGIVAGWAGNNNHTLGDVCIENVEAVNCTVKGGGGNTGGLFGSTGWATIKNCKFQGTVEAAAGKCAGIMGQAYGDATSPVENCSVEATLKSEGRYIAGIMGQQSGAVDVKNCTFKGTIETKFDLAGGIIAWATEGLIENCVVEADITAIKKSDSNYAYVGGILGYNTSGKGLMTIRNCMYKGTLSAKGTCVAGIFGDITSPALIENCAAMGTINSTQGYAAGIAAYVTKTGPATIRNCYTNFVINDAHSKGYSANIAADISTNTVIENCYAKGKLNGGYGLGGIVGRASNITNMGGNNNQNYNITVQKCITDVDVKTVSVYEKDGASYPGESPDSHYSIGAVVGYTGFLNVMADCYRKADMEFFAYSSNYNGTGVDVSNHNELYDQENSGPETPLVQKWTDPVTDKYFCPYHGKAYTGAATAVAKTLGWDDTIWNLSGDTPMLAQYPDNK